MAAEQDEMMKTAEKALEDLQDAAKETAIVIVGFGGKIQLCGHSLGRVFSIWPTPASIGRLHLQGEFRMSLRSISSRIL